MKSKEKESISLNRARRIYLTNTRKLRQAHVIRENIHSQVGSKPAILIFDAAISTPTARVPHQKLTGHLH